tara:strand:- start:15812 stop:16240 length:429 start_codon:yes stop_codon:yes gene_type:complete
MAYPKRPKEIFEILEEFSKETTKAGRIGVLHKFESTLAFTDLLRGTFDDTLVFRLPVGKPPYTANNEESYPSSLLKKHKDFHMFVTGGNLTQIRAENAFIAMLEAIHPTDAEVVLSMIAKTSPAPYLTKKLVQEAFPHLITK